MACNKLIHAYRLANGQIQFHQSGDVVADEWLACGQCMGCRLERRRQWMIRSLGESKLYGQDNSFVTLTFDDKHYPEHGNLDYTYWQKFMERLRYEIYPRKARFYMCGEYGEQKSRQYGVNPHFHGVLFGVRFPDQKVFKKPKSGNTLYTSELLTRLWPFGFHTIGAVTPQTCGYVSGYCLKKMTGDIAKEYYKRIDLETGEIFQLTPEFNQMSRKPGIGHDWLMRYYKDYYHPGGNSSIVVNGREQKAPRYYDKIYATLNQLGFEAVQYDRYLQAKLIPVTELSDERLAAKNEVLEAREAAFAKRRA